MGTDLITKVCEATGLPKELIQNKLVERLEQEGFQADTLTIEELRTVIASYLQEVLLEAREIY